ncbi:MAG: peptidoglycan-associated lipoprotein Pal [Nitrospirota bacterium]|nr:peptidoglycan-associated lipoprotein Pal [Nitrospirota bacterium]
MERRKGGMLVLFTVVMTASLVLWGCPKKAEVASSQEAQANGQAGTIAQAEAVKQAEEQQAAEHAKQAEEEQARERAAKEADGLKPVHFDFDRAIIRDDARIILKANAEWLRSHPQAVIRIEGNCDERGTIEYNQALGQRRALSAKKYLVDMGVAAKRISLLSYGKEKPICTESIEDCWQNNRRGDFVVTAGQ